ncbi:transporter substrate-binding domain-containing protein [Pokkaliibacter sp. CJK22405]|uniref:transporter substrate-binding domain-containing protein n=1 Tax=Pokkaliibacter sp. CJK22405 TaxID=3384615 RepID=UPI0039852565
MPLMKNTLTHVAAAVMSLGLTMGAMSAHAADNTLEAIKEAKVLKIGVAPGDPWYFKDPITGKWSGIGVMVGQRLADDLGVKMQTVETTYGNSVAALQAKQFDVMLVLDATAERRKALDFPETPLLWYKQGVLVKDGITATNWQDLNTADSRIGVALGTATDRDLTKRLPNAKIERFANTDETIAAFMAGRVDGFAFYHPALAIALSHIKKGKLLVPEPVIELPTSGGIRKEDDKAFLNFLDSEFKAMNADGSVNKIYTDYMSSKGLNPADLPSVEKSK